MSYIALLNGETTIMSYIALLNGETTIMSYIALLNVETTIMSYIALLNVETTIMSYIALLNGEIFIKSFCANRYNLLLNIPPNYIKNFGGIIIIIWSYTKSELLTVTTSTILSFS